MHLRHLELHGYKSFANKTEFAFNGGVTVIVGPNGSGKSNIADAVRWVLGEKRQRALRARRTEDMIFAGTDRRGQVGMAQVSMTLDNTDHWLPIDFGEVTITRRAYRSSENEYLLNGTAVRLQDIVHLLGQGGLSSNTYSVIGQGMVDAALSLQAEQRRSLFEDAAGLSVFQAKRAEASRKLAATEENLQRAQDIMREIAPRLGRLKRQAGRAEEHAHLDEQLRERLRLWYGFRWHEAHAASAEADAALKQARASEAEAKASVDEAEKQLADLRKRQVSLRQTLESDREAQARQRESLESHNRELSVLQERQRFATQRQEELAGEIVALQEEKEAKETRIASLEGELTELAERLESQQADLDERQKRLAETETRAEKLQSSLAQLRRERARLAARLTEADRDLAQSLARHKELGQERLRHQKTIREREEQAAAIKQQMAEMREGAAEVAQQMSTLATAQAEKEAALRVARRKKDSLERQAHEIASELRAVQARYDLLSRLRQEGAGLDSGVKALVRAAESGGLKGFIGPVARLFRVDEQYQAAIQAALDSRAQAVVFDTWKHAADALAWLQQAEAGRAELLVAEQLASPPRVALPKEQGLLGVAADLVNCQPAHISIIKALLGAVIVVEIWDMAHQYRARGLNGLSVVTLAGERIGPHGLLVAGGGGAGATDVLAMEREWHPLAKQIGELKQESTKLRERTEEAKRWEAKLAEQAKAIARQSSTLEEEWDARRQGLASAERERERLTQEIGWHRELVAKESQALDKLTQLQEVASQAQAQSRSEQQALHQRVAVLEGHLAHTRAEKVGHELAQARTALAVLTEQTQTHQILMREQRQAYDRMNQQLAARQEKLAQLRAEREALQAAIEKSEKVVLESRVSLDAEVARFKPALAELNALAEEQIALEETVAGAREQQRIRQDATHQAELTHMHNQDGLEHLRKQMTHDLGLVEPEEVPEGQPRQSLLPFESMVTSLPTITVLPKGLEQDVRRLRRRLGSMGAINPDAPQEYAELQERHDFLKTQSDDLREAAQDLRQVSAELEEVMRERFRSTFEAIAQAFERYFNRLFGGGEARLVLTEPDDLMRTGIEIMARVPGKRRQPISLLSGGERALTAASLIFALVGVSKTPFCVLDEVDAMLDEANIGKFCETLQELSQTTQFIVITHNRGTIEAGETIYGISLGDSGVSKVVSLKVDEAMRAAK